MRQIAFVFCLAFLPLQTLAQDRVLFEPLTEREEADARAKNTYFIGIHTFAAKRHRLVNVNIELLETDGRIVIPLFDDNKIVADSTAIKIREASGTLSWRGQLVQDAVTEEVILQSLVDQGVPEHLDHPRRVELARTLFADLTNVQIGAGFYERDSKTGANLNPIPFTGLTAAGLLGAISSCQSNRYAQYSSNPGFVRGASAYLGVLNEPTQYRLKMLGMGGPYHILYEVDPSRQIVSGNDVIVPGEPYESGLSEEQEQKNEILMQELKVLKESLGDNPHDALYDEKMKQVRDAELKQPIPSGESCTKD